MEGGWDSIKNQEFPSEMDGWNTLPKRNSSPLNAPGGWKTIVSCRFWGNPGDGIMSFPTKNQALLVISKSAAGACWSRFVYCRCDGSTSEMVDLLIECTSSNDNHTQCLSNGFFDWSYPACFQRQIPLLLSGCELYTSFFHPWYFTHPHAGHLCNPFLGFAGLVVFIRIKSMENQLLKTPWKGHEPKNLSDHRVAGMCHDVPSDRWKKFGASKLL